MTLLSNLHSPKSTKKSKKLGRGIGSGVGGHTVGRGGKGATARSGYQYPNKDFEGGQMRLSRRLPKLKGESSSITRRHFTSNLKKIVIHLSDIEKQCKESSKNEVNIDTLVEFGLFKPKFNKISIVKVLFDKPIEMPIKFKGILLSKKAREAVLSVGGSVE